MLAFRLLWSDSGCDVNDNYYKVNTNDKVPIVINQKLYVGEIILVEYDCVEFFQLEHGWLL